MKITQLVFVLYCLFANQNLKLNKTASKWLYVLYNIQITAIL